MLELKIGLNEDYLQYGIEKPITWIPEKTPHVVIVGSTGSGKTYFTKLLLGKVALASFDAKLYVCDFKGDKDFTFLESCNNFYRFEACSDGLNDFYKKFKLRQEGIDSNRNMLILFFDEWASYCNNLEKKGLEEAKKTLATLLMLGRSFNVQVIISQQRADASYFSSARDNFNLVIGLGNLSEESKKMLFHGFKEQMKANRKQGTGYVLKNGSILESILVPRVARPEKLHRCIKKAVDN